MSKETIVVGINGPMRVGKSWFARKAKSGLPLRISSSMLAVRDFIWEEYAALHGIQESSEEFKAQEPETYRTGLIQLSEKRRRENTPDYWVEKFIKTVRECRDDFIFCDSIAFHDEHNYLWSRIPRFVTIVIAPAKYDVGDYYDDSYRRCVYPAGGFRATNSSEALKQFKTRVEHAQHYLEERDFAGVARVLGI